ncbi:ribbon-helix-helix domain-containing protein [Shinella granuli]|jgi:predicted DNA-binding ribbon-helix-helix protein|uniref:Putative DNA-binding ribbon-helix-helix protein n=2 Tax=Shinella TaxID=323620 RepID=A0A4R2BPK0_SHIGR|nr:MULTISPECIES: ribbon-helix-helix domain-containing protein [Shinella]ANH08291.1 hypothetical protein shn_29525 [Shinella sp. HZN7]TCN29226.1 putative DNA-binding ribbon-helix-helix protein [Shinella granuli]
MCRVLTTHSQERFTKINRSIRIAGHSTSVRLESAFWDVLEDIASREGLSTAQLISVLYHEALDKHGCLASLASMLRTVCVIYQEERNARSALS